VSYSVVITGPADRDFRKHYEWIHTQSIQGSENWRKCMIAAIRPLTTAPARHVEARESSAFSVKIHCLLVGKQRSFFRILYHLSETEVRILAIRRPAQDFLTPDESVDF